MTVVFLSPLVSAKWCKIPYCDPATNVVRSPTSCHLKRHRLVAVVVGQENLFSTRAGFHFEQHARTRDSRQSRERLNHIVTQGVRLVAEIPPL